jgi:hypothetical protein
MAKRILMVAIAIAAWSGLAIQIPYWIAVFQSLGMTLIGAIIGYFSFFTILTNIFLAVGLTTSLCAPRSRWGRWFSLPAVTAATATSIMFVGLAYFALLRDAWHPRGIQILANILLHYVVPSAYLACWLLFFPKAAFRWVSALEWSAPPLAYLFCVMIRGAITGFYPYPFLDPVTLGYRRVALNVALIICAFIFVCLILIAVSRRLSRDSAAENSLA